jgi:hypothetical protein
MPGSSPRPRNRPPASYSTRETKLRPNRRNAPNRTSTCTRTLLLVDALERHEVEVLEEMGTDALVNLYTLLSDVQRNVNDLRQGVADVLLNRLHHDRPVSGPFDSVQRTMRRNRSLNDDEEVLETLEETGIDRERVLRVDRDKMDDALDVTELSESDVYDIEESGYVGRPRWTRSARKHVSKASKTSLPPPRVTRPKNCARKSKSLRVASRN